MAPPVKISIFFEYWFYTSINKIDDKKNNTANLAIYYIFI